ncbi:MAG: hypothetical protein IIC82_06680 [Chloroflexi bacterium]|nr:hypothetical protein [Chloroflexota bacterium]
MFVQEKLWAFGDGPDPKEEWDKLAASDRFDSGWAVHTAGSARPTSSAVIGMVDASNAPMQCLAMSTVPA